MKQMCLFLIKKSFLWKLFDVDFILVYTSSSYAGNRHALEYKRILRNRLYSLNKDKEDRGEGLLVWIEKLLNWQTFVKSGR